MKINRTFTSFHDQNLNEIFWQLITVVPYTGRKLRHHHRTGVSFECKQRKATRKWSSPYCSVFRAWDDKAAIRRKAHMMNWLLAASENFELNLYERDLDLNHSATGSCHNSRYSLILLKFFMYIAAIYIMMVRPVKSSHNWADKSEMQDTAYFIHGCSSYKLTGPVCSIKSWYLASWVQRLFVVHSLTPNISVTIASMNCA